MLRQLKSPQSRRPQPGNSPSIAVRVEDRWVSIAWSFKVCSGWYIVPEIRHGIPRGKHDGLSHVHRVSKVGLCRWWRMLNLILFLLYYLTPPWMPVVRFLAVKWYPGILMRLSQMVSLSHVSMKNARSGLQSRMTDLTSSILGARLMVLASRRLRPYVWASVELVGLSTAVTLEIIRLRWKGHAGLLCRTREWLRDWITGMGQLFRLPATEESIWIFLNAVREEICKLSSWRSPLTSKKMGFSRRRIHRTWRWLINSKT